MTAPAARALHYEDLLCELRFRALTTGRTFPEPPDLTVGSRCAVASERLGRSGGPPNAEWLEQVRVSLDDFPEMMPPEAHTQRTRRIER